MTFLDTLGGWDATPGHAATTEKTNPPRKRVTPPLFIGDILMSRRDVPVFVEEWLRLERERDARRAERDRSDDSHL